MSNYRNPDRLGYDLALQRVRTDPELAALLEKARHHVMTPLEIYRQRVSWIYGEANMNKQPGQDIITEEQIEKMLLEKHGIAKPTE